MKTAYTKPAFVKRELLSRVTANGAGSPFVNGSNSN
jgi:hypothetical protein